MTRDVVITREPVELYKILKFEGLADNGGEAKGVIEEGRVKVNGVVETRKRKQIVAGDVIEFAGATLKIVRADGVEAAAPVPQTAQLPGTAKPPAKKKRARFPGRA
jgi:ribosome-associated protein